MWEMGSHYTGAWMHFRQNNIPWTQNAFVVALLVASVISLPCKATAQDTVFVTIGGGPITNASYATAGAICRLVNADGRDHGIKCSVQSTGGTVDNIDGLRDESLQMGIVRSDLQKQAFEGTGVFESDGAFAMLRALFSLYSEPFTVVAGSQVNLSTFTDLKGSGLKVVVSGQQELYGQVVDALGWTGSDLPFVLPLPFGEIASALCTGIIDVAIMGVAHPSSDVAAMLSTCNAKLVPASDAAIDDLVENSKILRKANIPGGAYNGFDDDIETFGFGATVVSSTAVSENAAYNVVKSVFDGFGDFKPLHPALAELEKESMAQQLNFAPLHDGARRYFEEKGLLDTNKDTDGDGIPDSSDNCPEVKNADQADNDDDKAGDACDKDDDNDGIPDTYEAENGLDPLDPDDANEDADGDGFSNLEEFELGTDPQDPDSFPMGVVGNPEMGEKVFKKCVACHSLVGANKVGPYLNGVLDRRAATAEGYRYSDALSRLDLIWTVENLNHWIFDSKLMVPGTRETFAGISSDQQRADVISFLAGKPVEIPSGDPVLEDQDEDGVHDLIDNCPMVENPGQEDGDEDSVGDACDPGPNGDFDGDGKSDIFWRHAENGRNKLWHMDGVKREAAETLPRLADSNWKVAGLADFTGNGLTDVLWRNGKTGANRLWKIEVDTRLRRGMLIVDQPVPKLSSVNWIVAGVGDFFDDGMADIFWHNRATGANKIWRMKGAKRGTQANLPKFPTTDWQPVGVADFNGNGKADIFWRNKKTGTNRMWLMNGFKRVVNAKVPTLKNRAWSVAGLGDYDEDGLPDILWRNGKTGANKIWLMNGKKRKAQGVLPPLTNKAWAIVGTGDYDVSGSADILWRHTKNGANKIWLMQGFVREGQSKIPKFADTKWEVQR